MQIKLLVSRVSAEKAWSPGEVIEVDDAEAIRMIDAGQAVPDRAKDRAAVEKAVAAGAAEEAAAKAAAEKADAEKAAADEAAAKAAAEAGEGQGNGA